MIYSEFFMVCRLFVGTFNDGLNHFKAPVWFYQTGLMCRNNDGVSGFQGIVHPINYNFRSSFDDLHENIEWGNFFCHPFPAVKRHYAYGAGRFFKNGFYHHRIWNILDNFNRYKWFRFFNFTVINIHITKVICSVDKTVIKQRLMLHHSHFCKPENEEITAIVAKKLT